MAVDEVVTKEELAQLNKDTEQALNKLGDKLQQDTIAKAKVEAKAEAKQEFEIASKLAEQERVNKELQAKLEATQKATSEQLAALQKKVDESIGSRAVINPKNPFVHEQQKDTSANHVIDSLSEDQINEVEEASARAFFGEEYDGQP
jgi:transketolase